ncbi:hypothetical protein PRIC1_001358 [Phytophthora ramorum]
MATVQDSPVSSAKLTALGMALDQASISSAGGVVSPAATNEALDDDDDAPAPKLPTKSPKKRGRTDSLKKMLPAPASQRHKQVESPQSSTEEDSAASPSTGPTQETPPQPQQRPQAQPAKLMVKDRRGSGMGVPRAHLILNAVKQAPPAKEKSNPRRWSKHEDESLRLAVERSGERNWKAIADQVPGRNHTQCLQRWTKVLKPGLIKGHWTPEEDAKLRDLVAEGKKNWGQVASLIPGRTSKQCRERWCNHLDPNINKGSYTEDEDKIIVEMQAKLGNRWSIIAQQLKGRTEDAVKIRWKSLMRGRRAASKEDKTPTAATVSPAAATVNTSPSSPADVEQSKAKPSKASPVRPKNHPLTATTTTEVAPTTTVKTELENAPENRCMPDASPPTEAASLGIMPSTVFVKNAQTLAPASQPGMTAAIGGPMHNVNDLVAASIHNFQMSQRFHPSSVAHASNVLYPANTNQMMGPSTQQPPAVYAIADGGSSELQHEHATAPNATSTPVAAAHAATAAILSILTGIRDATKYGHDAKLRGAVELPDIEPNADADADAKHVNASVIVNAAVVVDASDTYIFVSGYGYGHGKCAISAASATKPHLLCTKASAAHRFILELCPWAPRQERLRSM